MTVGGVDLGEWPASYITMAGPDMEAIQEDNLMISGNFKVYMNPQDSRGSLLFEKLNPVQQYPVQNMNVRAFTSVPHLLDPAIGAPGDMTADDYYALILAADSGVNFYSREINPGLSIY
jgi:hypothetical protein